MLTVRMAPFMYYSPVHYAPKDRELALVKRKVAETGLTGRDREGRDRRDGHTR